MKDKPTEIKCLQCGDIIKSDGSGKWVSCSCGKCYIDQTEYYCKIGGDFKKVEIEDNGNWVLLEKYIDDGQKSEN